MNRPMPTNPFEKEKHEIDFIATDKECYETGERMERRRASENASDSCQQNCKDEGKLFLLYIIYSIYSI